MFMVTANGKPWTSCWLFSAVCTLQWELICLNCEQGVFLNFSTVIRRITGKVSLIRNIFFHLPQVRFCPHKNRCLWTNESEEYRNCLSSPLHLPTIKVLRLWRFQRETSWQSGCYLGYWYHLPGESVPILITFLPQRDFDGMKHHGM